MRLFVPSGAFRERSLFSYDTPLVFLLPQPLKVSAESFSHGRERALRKPGLLTRGASELCLVSISHAARAFPFFCRH